MTPLGITLTDITGLLLWLPADADKSKRKALHHFMTGLAQLRHPGAHGHSDTQIERADAELALTVALSLFRYIGEVTANRA